MVLIFAATTLLSAPAQAVTPPPQTGTGGSSASTVRERCATCREGRVEREKLLLRIDSLRWQIENRRLTEEERSRTVGELNLAIRALQHSLDEAAQGSAVTTVTVNSSGQAMVGQMSIARIPMRARGYLGVTFDGPSAEIARPGDYAVRFYKYPRIALVEPSSPAERAGVLQGDTLMAFNGTDVVNNEISLTKLLVPDTRVTMRVRRDGDSKDLKVTIGEPPDYYVRRREVPRQFEAGAAPVAIGAAPARGASPAPQVAAAWPPEQQAPVILWQDNEGVAGARVETVSEGLGKALGVDEGVLVVRVRPGTPAYRAGLRDGDVIVRAGGQRVATVLALRGILSAGEGEEGVKLLIRRDRKERDLTLRW